MEKIVKDVMAYFHSTFSTEKNETNDLDLKYIRMLYSNFIENTNCPIYRLFYEIYKDIITKSSKCTFKTTELVIFQCLPRQFLKFFQDCCNYLSMLKQHTDCEKKYSMVLNNFAIHVTNYLVYLHGMYVLKNTPGSLEALSLEEYYGEATFNTEEDRRKIFRKYFIIINSMFDKFLRCTNNIKSL